MSKFRPEQLWEALVEAGTHFVIVTDVDGKILHVNSRTEQLLGMPRREIIGKKCTFFDAEEIAVRARDLSKAHNRKFAPDYSALAWEALQGTTTVRECTVVNLARRRRALQWIIAPVRGADAKVAGVVWLARAEDAPVASRGRRDLLVAAVRSLDDAFITLDVRGAVTTWNRGAVSMFGYSEREMVGQSLATIAQPEHGWEVPVLVDRVISGKPIVPFETERRAKDGTTVHVKMSFSPIRTEGGSVAGIAVQASPVRRRRKKTEELVDSEERYQCALEGEYDGVWDWDVDSDELYLSPQLTSAFGLEDEKNATLLMSAFTERLHPAYRATLSKALQDHVTSGARIDLECRLQNKDDAARWLWIRGRIQPAEAGQHRRVVGTITDITHHVAQKDELRAALSRARVYERLFEIGNALPAIIGFDGHLKRIGPSWERLLGYTREELYSRPWQDLVVEEDRERTAAEMSRVESEGGELGWFVNRLRKKDGGDIWLAWTAKADADEELLYASAHDITELKQTKAELDENTQLLVDAAHSAAFGAWEIDAATDEFSGSKVVHEVLDWPAEKEAKLEALLAAFLPEGQAVLRAAIEEARRDGTPFDIEAQAKTSAIGPFWIRVQGRGEGDGEAPLRVYGTLQDVTDKKARDIAKSEFVSIVSHELRTPLTSIRGALRLLEGGVVGELPAKARELVEIASSNSLRLVELVNDILDLEKMEAGKFQMRREEVDLAKVFEEAERESEGYAQQLGVKVAFDVGPGACVIGDRDRLAQVLVNLVTNAVKFSDAGQVVRVVASQRESGEVRVSVKDDGAGISPDDIDRLFQKFQQLPTPRADHAVGTGLGLAIAKAIVEQHHGRVGVESVVGLGTTFWFELASSRPDKFDAPEGFRDVLLITDDDEVVARLTATMGNQGYRIRHAARLSEAESAVHESPPDAIVVDAILPDGTGVAWLGALREQPAFSELPVVAISDPKDEGERAGAPGIDWLMKPLDDTELVRAVRRAVRHPGRARALLVEDDPGIRTVLRTQLEELGIECTTASDGAAAVEVVDDVDPDLIVLDLSLPRMNGFEVVETLKHQKTRGVPLLVYTGHELSDADRSVLQLGATKHLMKARSSHEDFTVAVKDLLGAAIANSAEPLAGE